MSNEAKVISGIFDNLLKHGYRALTGVVKIDELLAVTVHQNGTEIVHYDIPGYRNPLLETRPIIIAGGAGRLALTFTSGGDLGINGIAESLRRRHGLYAGMPEVKDKLSPIIQPTSRGGTVIHYPSRTAPLKGTYTQDTVRIDASSMLSNLDIEPAIVEAVQVGGICLLGYEKVDFSQVLLNSARSLDRLAT